MLMLSYANGYCFYNHWFIYRIPDFNLIFTYMSTEQSFRQMAPAPLPIPIRVLGRNNKNPYNKCLHEPPERWKSEKLKLIIDIMSLQKNDFSIGKENFTTPMLTIRSKWWTRTKTCTKTRNSRVKIFRHKLMKIFGNGTSVVTGNTLKMMPESIIFLYFKKCL